MQDLNPAILLPVLCGVIFTIFGIVIIQFPPKLKNSYYGYRTKRSKQSQSTWDFAQKYSSKLMVISGISLCCTSLIGVYAQPTEPTAVITGLILVLISVSSVIIATEIALKKNFPNN